MFEPFLNSSVLLAAEINSSSECRAKNFPNFIKFPHVLMYLALGMYFI